MKMLLCPLVAAVAVASAAASDARPDAGRGTASAYRAAWHESVASQLPRFAPPGSRTPRVESTSLAATPDSDGPVFVLPDFFVTEHRRAPLHERDLLTPKGRADLAVKRYSSRLDRLLNGHVLPWVGLSIESRVLAEQAEDDRLAAMADLDRTARAIAQIDRASGQDYQRIAANAYAR